MHPEILLEPKRQPRGFHSPFTAETPEEGDVPAIPESHWWTQYAIEGAGGDAEDHLVTEHLRLVRIVVSRIALTLPSHVETEDLHSAGLIGLLDALRRYDRSCGASFPTYARLRIRGAVLDELRRLDWVPRTIHEKARRVQEVMQRLEQEIGEVPLEEEMADALNMSLGQYRQLLVEIRPATFICLDAISGTPRADGHHEEIALIEDESRGPERTAELHENAELLARRIERLPDAQRKVLALYYYEDLTLREIAEAFGVSESRICQIHGQAILALKLAFHRDSHQPGERNVAARRMPRRRTRANSQSSAASGPVRADRGVRGAVAPPQEAPDRGVAFTGVPIADSMCRTTPQLAPCN